MQHAPARPRRLEDAQVVTFARREWVALHTPGHTLDHLCLFDPVEGVVLSGDHVLPTITPHISGVDGAGDPLAAVLRLAGPHDQARRRHRRACRPTATRSTTSPGGSRPSRSTTTSAWRSLGAASAEIGRSASVNELMQHLFSERAWGSMAESETYAHLEHLRLAGHADSHWEDGKLSTT